VWKGTLWRKELLAKASGAGFQKRRGRTGSFRVWCEAVLALGFNDGCGRAEKGPLTGQGRSQTSSWSHRIDRSMQIIVETASIPDFPVQILVSVLAAIQLVTGVRDSLLPRGSIT